MTQGRRRALCWGLYGLAVLALCFAFAWQRCFLLDYNPVDGDFQSYNVFRRMLEGQRPYTDFANYVGMAPVVLNLPFLLFNGSFAASLFVTNFTCCLLFCLCALLVLWLVCRNAPLAMLAAAVLPKLVASGLVGLLGAPGAYLTTLYTNLFTPSNSMRIARSFWPFLLVLVFLLFDSIHLHRKGAHYMLAKAPGSRVFCALLGGLAGLGVVWSNDFGLAVIFSASLLLVLLLAKLKPGAAGFFLRLGIYLACLGAGALLGAALATGGHPAAWWNATLGVGGAQYWYFSGTSGRALLTVIFGDGRLLFYTAGTLAFLLWCLVRLIRGKLCDLELLGGFLALSILAATYAYILSGSGYNFTEALEGFFWLAALGAALRGALWLARRWNRQLTLACTAALAAVALLLGGLGVREVIRQNSRPREGHYVEALGGWVNYPVALDAAAALTEGEEVFSLYATGLELVKGSFQPSGYDYVIHALGGEARAAYLASFEQGRYPWAQTTALELERWLCVENWDIYRRIAANYERSMRTEYSWLWRRAADQHLDPEALDVAVATKMEDGRLEIEITAEPGANFTADICVSYTTGFSSAGGAVLSLGRRCVAAALPDPVGDGDTVWGYFAAENEALRLPIAVRNGHGTATLVPCDPNQVWLAYSRVALEGVLPDLRAPDWEIGRIA